MCDYPVVSPSPCFGLTQGILMTRPKKTKPDSNQAEIVEELRSLGFDVDIICDLPGLYDLVVSGRRHIMYGSNLISSLCCSLRVEVKTEKGLVTDREFEYYNNQLHKDSYIVARSAADVLRWFNG